MKQIDLDLFTEYSFLSDLKLSNDESKLYFTETRADVEHNGYLQRLHEMDTATKEVKTASDWQKKTATFFLGDELYLITKDEEDPTVHTQFVQLKDESIRFKLPCAVNSIKDLNDQYYLALISINRSCANDHHLSAENRKANVEKRKADEDYVVFDEYPFFFNGAGITNGDRNMLVLIDKQTYEITDLTSSTMDVESYDVVGDDILYSGVDFTTFKGKWSWVYRINTKTLQTEVLYDDVMQISRVFELQGKIFVLGTFGKEYGAMEANKFYELKDKKMTLVCDNEYSMYNSVGSDCRYGKTKNFMKKKDKAYFITTDHERSIVLEFDGAALMKVADVEGSCDDLAVSSTGLYVIGMKQQMLQEVYEIKQKLEVLTSFNTAVLEDKYVAKPQKISVDKPMRVDGWVLLPKDFDPGKKYPAILDIHGGPKTAYGEVFYHEMQHWASLGYFVMFCNPRGSDGKGNAFADLRKSWGTIDYEDIMDFVDEVLKNYPSIDSERLGVTGGSYGGYMTNWIIGHTNRFKAAATQRSISNWITEVCASDYGIDFPIEQEYDDIYNCHDELWDMSPLKYANEAVTPTLFIQSTEDYRCPIPEAIQLYTVLKCRGVESRLVAFKGENHDLSRTGKPLHRIRRLKEITDWMTSHL